MKTIKPALVTLASALLFVGIATAVKLALNPWIGRNIPFLLYFVAIIASAWRGGARAGFLAIALSVVTSVYFFFPPYGLLVLQEPIALVRVAVFILEGSLICLITAALHGARRRAEQSVAEAMRTQSSLATTLQSIGDAVIATDPTGDVVIMNPVAERLTGWSTDKAVGRPLSDVFRIVNEKTRKEVESPVEKVIREGTVVGMANHTVLIGRTGSETPIDDSGAPIHDQEGKLTGVVLVFRDVTTKKREEERREFLGEASAALASSLDHKVTLALVARLAVPKLADWCAVDILEEGADRTTRLAVAHIDPTKIALALEIEQRYPVDPKAKTGLPEVIRTGKAEIYPELPEALLAASAVDAEHLRLIRELNLGSAMIVPLIARDRTLGAITLVHAESGRHYTDEDLAFAHDLARRAALAIDNARLYAAERSAREAADSANRMKDEFLSTVSHELRTPLNAMLGWTRMLRSGELDEAKRARGLEVIERNAVAQAQLIEDLLDVSRIISGKLLLNIGLVDLRAVIDAAIDSVKPAMEAKQLRLQATVDPTLAPIPADPHRIQQVVWNLLSNAIKFTPKQGTIKLELSRGDARVELTVTDSGPGISREFLPHIFERFRQADSSITRTHGGLGLGLAICRHIVELHGGTINAESRGGGQGATFTVDLPVAPPSLPGEAVAAIGPAPSGPQLEFPAELCGLKVLIVEDEQDARDLLAAVIEKGKGRAITVGTVAEALAALQRESPDVLLSDIGLPDEDGYELIRKIRALDPARGGRIPAAALTAYARAEDRRKALVAGYQTHVPKPVEPAELLAVIASLMRFSRPPK